MFTRRHALTLIAAVLLPGGAAFAQDAPVSNVGGIAIRGADTVAYFTEGRAVQGRAEFAVKWMGAVWYFASIENMERFMADPRAYAPQYGGYCAYAASKGAVAEADPNAFAIVDGKLYLTYSMSARESWSKDVPGNLGRANATWARIGRKSASR